MAFVTVEGEKREYPEGIPFSAIAADFREKVSHDILLVKADGRLRELGKKLKGDCEISLITAAGMADLPEERRVFDAEGLL